MIQRILAILLVATLPFALAQSLADLLPAETMVALGTTGLQEHEGLLDSFIAEFESRGVGEAFLQLFGDLEEGAPDVEAEIPEPLQGLGPLDVIGQDAWIAVSASQFNPIPAVTLVARTSPEATQAFGDLIAGAADDEGVQEFSEGGVPFWVSPLDMQDAPAQAIAYAQSGDVTLLSTNPDVLRGVLRRLGGSGEPGFTTSEAYGRTLGQLGAADFSGFLDLSALATVTAPFTQGLGFDAQIDRLQRALRTAGASGGVVRLEPDGISSTSISAPDPDGGDVALYNLLTTPGTYDPATLQFLPATGLTVSTGHTDLTGWWNWLNDLVGSLPDMGVQSLDGIIRDMLGIDLRATFFSWTGTHTATITAGMADVAQPGMPAANLLGELVYVIETIDEDAARQGLSMLFGTLSNTVAAFADPDGGAGGAGVQQQTMSGVTVDTYRVTTGVELATAVTRGYALIATSTDAMQAVLAAADAQAGLPPVFADMLARAPSGARSVALSDSRAVMESTARQLATTLQLGAGFGGASTLDFEAVTRATEAVEGYLLFIASRLGGSYSATEVVDRILRTNGHTSISW